MFTDEAREEFYTEVPAMMYHFPHMYYMQQKQQQHVAMQQRMMRQQQLAEQAERAAREKAGGSAETGAAVASSASTGAGAGAEGESAQPVAALVLCCQRYRTCRCTLRSSRRTPSASLVFHTLSTTVSLSNLPVVVCTTVLVLTARLIVMLTGFCVNCQFALCIGPPQRMDAESLRSSGMLSMLTSPEGREKLQSLAAKVSIVYEWRWLFWEVRWQS